VQLPRFGIYSPAQSDAPIKNSPTEITVVPGSEHMLNTVNFDGSQPNTIAPETKVTMAMHVLNTGKDSTSGTKVTPQRRDSAVAENVTGRATFLCIQ
jgi:hypothetical protein